MIDTSFIKELSRLVGPEHVSAGSPARKVYSYDASLAERSPAAVVFPADTGQTAAVVRAACRAGVPFVPRGFGTNLSGGSVPPDKGLIVCLSRLNRILSIDLKARSAVVQPGVPNLDLQNALAEDGYFYAPDPASQKVATLGGNAAENSGGPRCLKYGVTTNHILGLEVVLSGGEVVDLGGPAGDAPGGDLRGYLIGSEGTLGVVTAVTVRILPLPEDVATMLVIYDDVDAAARTVSDIISRGIVPAGLEMMDQPVMHAVEDSFPCGYPRDAAAVLIIEVEGFTRDLPDQAARIRQICEENHCREIRTAKDREERDKLWAGRRGAFGAMARMAPRYLVADCTVPRTRLPLALKQVAEITQKHHLSVGNVFHAGDGNLHPLLMFDPRIPGSLEAVHRAGQEVMQACVDLGGTITGEHGVGAEKREAMRLVFSEDDLALMRDLKKTFDPQNLINPGKIIPEAGPVEEAPPPPEATWEESPELLPENEGQAADMIRRASTDGRFLVPLGRGRLKNFGNLSSVDCTIIRSTGLKEETEYDPANLVVTASAGRGLAELQEILAENRQWLPLRPPGSNRTTLGGVAALGACGPERLAYGAPRDLLLGLKFISGRGRLISGGGRVVKNVAGYDLTRLLAGSAGTFGLLTRLTFKVLMRPETSTALKVKGSLSSCQSAAEALLASNLNPTFIAAARRKDEPDWLFSIGFEGLFKTVEEQVKRTLVILKTNDFSSPGRDDYELFPGPWDKTFRQIYDSPFVLRTDAPLDQTGYLAGAAVDLSAETILADFGCGRITSGLKSLSSQDWSQFNQLSGQSGGWSMLEDAPDEFKAGHDVFGPGHKRPDDWPKGQGSAGSRRNIFSGPGTRPEVIWNFHRLTIGY